MYILVSRLFFILYRIGRTRTTAAVIHNIIRRLYIHRLTSTPSCLFILFYFFKACTYTYNMSHAGVSRWFVVRIYWLQKNAYIQRQGGVKIMSYILLFVWPVIAWEFTFRDRVPTALKNMESTHSEHCRRRRRCFERGRCERANAKSKTTTFFRC